jgi:hypothetical protein
MCVVKKGVEMSEIGAIDSISTPIYQLNTQRAAFNPFAPVEEMSDVESAKVKENPFNTATQVIEAFNLYDPKNRLLILSLFSRDQQQDVISLLGKESMVLGMKLYDEDKILNLLFDTSQQDISKVLMGSMPMEKIFELIPEELLNNFILSKDLEKPDFMAAFEQFSPQELGKLLETIMGVPQKNRPLDEMLNVLSGLPLEFLQPSLLATKPEQKTLLIANMMKSNNELFDLFPKAQLLIPLDKVGKEKTLNGFGNLEEGMLSGMLKQLPDELLPLLLTLIEPEKLAKALIEKYQDVIIKALSGQAR